MKSENLSAKAGSGNNVAGSKPRMSIKDRRSKSNDMGIELSLPKNSNMFLSGIGNNATPGLKQPTLTAPVNTPYNLEATADKGEDLFGYSNADIIMESEEEETSFAPPFARPLSNFGSPKRWYERKESMNGIFLSRDITSPSPSHNGHSSSPPHSKTGESSNNTTPVATKFRFGNHSRSNSNHKNYQSNFESNKQYVEKMKSSSDVMGRTTSLSSNLELSLGQRTKLGTNKSSSLSGNSTGGVTGLSHKYSNSSGFDKSKKSSKHKHNLSLPQAHMMAASLNCNSDATGDRIFGDKFFKINVEHQKTLSPLLDSVDSEALKKMNAVKRFHESRHEGEHDTCTKNLEIYDSDSKVAFFQKHYKVFKEKAVERYITGNIPLVPEWLDHLLLTQEKLYFIRRFHKLSYLERERIDKYFLYQKNLFENSSKSLEKTLTSDPTNSELFSGEVFENGIKNRYKSVIPYQRTRVILQENARRHNSTNYTPLAGNNTYFNGNYLCSPFKANKSSSYIATQAPLEHTIRDFFNVLISNNVRMVLTLTKEIENGMNKCSSFWRDNMDYNGIHCELVDEYSLNDEHMNDCVYKDTNSGIAAHKSKNTFNTSHGEAANGSYFDLSFNGSNQHIAHDVEDSLIIRVMKLTWLDVKTGEPKEWGFMQIQMTSWPDFGVPSCNCDLLNVLNMKAIVNKLTNTEKQNFVENKILVHCSSGSGRSGAICCTDSLIDIILNDDGCFSIQDPVYDIVASFREQRLHMVQNVNQYFLIYDCLVSFLQAKLDLSWDTFENRFKNLKIFREFGQMIK